MHILPFPAWGCSHISCFLIGHPLINGGRHEKEKIGGLVPEQIEAEIERTKKLLSELDSLLAADKTRPWLFGLESPTALDTHLVVFLVRLQDVGRHELIPEGLSRYVDVATSKREWQQLMGEQRTVPPRPK